MKLHNTENDISSNVRITIITLLNKALASTIDLALITKQAHWNIKGPHFIAIHEMLDNLRDTLDEHADEIGERVAQLGGTALGTTQNLSKNSILEPYPTDIFSGADHLKALINRYSKVANLLRKSIDQSDELGDTVTADLFTGAAKDLDKSLWFLEAHIQEKS